MTDFTPKPPPRVPLPLEWLDEAGFEIPCRIQSKTDRWIRILPPAVSSSDTSFIGPPPLRP